MKKLILIISLSLVVIFGTIFSINAYNDYQEYLHSEIKVEYRFVEPVGASFRPEYFELTNEEKFYVSVIADSTCGVIGKYNSFRQEGDLGYWNFDVRKIVYGEIEEENIDITAIIWQLELLDENSFKEGEEYMLFLVETDILFLDSPQYGFTAEYLIPINNLKKSKWNSGGSIKFSENTNAVNIAEHYEKIANERGYTKDKYIETIIRNEDLKTCVEKSEVVLRFKVKYKMLDAILWPASIYSAEKVECLKGEEYVKKETISCTIRAAKDSLEDGKEYIMTLSLAEPEKENGAFLQSALNGIIPIEDTETVEKVYEWLDLK